jgi:hypothetical protein
VQPEGLGKLKNPVTSSGLEPATFWLLYKLTAKCVQVKPIGWKIDDKHAQ